MFRGLSPFLKENGSYVLLATLAGKPLSIVRNRMLASKLDVRKLHIGSRAHLRGLASIEMGEDFSAGEGLWLEAVTHYGEQRFTPKIVIGNHVRISHWSHISCTYSITIGDHVLIGSKVMITDHNHGSSGTSPFVPPAQRSLESDRSTVVGSNVWLGDGVTICPGVTVGEGSVVGANAVVTSDVPPFTLVAGVPARPIRHFDAGLGVWTRSRTL